MKSEEWVKTGDSTAIATFIVSSSRQFFTTFHLSLFTFHFSLFTFHSSLFTLHCSPALNVTHQGEAENDVSAFVTFLFSEFNNWLFLIIPRWKTAHQEFLGIGWTRTLFFCAFRIKAGGTAETDLWEP
ncbi:MAG TPA: hypothetical protein VK208_17250 [Pyrinomonadaceae bacterium]|nr:hypothetical protein [Pyrinomonadaceae bacterium]